MAWPAAAGPCPDRADGVGPARPHCPGGARGPPAAHGDPPKPVERPPRRRAARRPGSAARRRGRPPRRPTPRRFTATRATGADGGTVSPRHWSPRTRTRCPPGQRQPSPTASVPAPSVPVTTVPLPRIVNERSTKNRTRAAASGCGSETTSRSRAARSSASPCPLSPLTGTASTAPRLVPASRSTDSARAARVGEVAAGHRDQPVPDPQRVQDRDVLRVCARQPSSAATTSSAAGTGPAPASMVGTNRSCPGTSTKARPPHRSAGRPAEAEVEGHPPPLLLGQPVRVHARQRTDQCRLAVIDMAGGGDDVQGASVVDFGAEADRNRTCLARLPGHDGVEDRGAHQDRVRLPVPVGTRTNVRQSRWAPRVVRGQLPTWVS